MKKVRIKDLVKPTGLSRNTISNMENGTGNPTFYSVQAYLNELGYELRILVKE